jgi:transposase-like protein
MKSLDTPVCPRCGSADFSPDLSSSILYSGFNSYRCNSCGYTGTFFIKMAAEAKPAKK